MAMYKKRQGTSTICCQLYETKLISLLYLRALHDETIEEFQLASNVDDIGSFDDFCFRAKIKGYVKSVAMFVQTKHRSNITSFKGSFDRDLFVFFDSYLKIRRKFDSSNKDPLFNGRFEESECLFVIYTNANISLTTATDALIGSRLLSKLDYLIGTGGTVGQLYKKEEFVKSLYKVFMKEEIIHLARCIARCIHGENLENMLSDRIVQRYHVILAQTVLDVSDIQAGGHRIASFRHDFFDTDEEYLTMFKFALIKEFGNIRKMFVSQSTKEKALDLAAREILSDLHFKVPAAFGNKDLTIRGNNANVERRIHYLVEKIRNLLVNYELTLVTVDDSLDQRLLQLDGGIAGAIGNIFVLDDDPKLMKITDNSEQLGPLAKRLYTKLNENVPILLEYKFCFNVNTFPKLTFECNNYDEILVKDFFNRLIFFYNQANETKVEQIVKKEIEHYQFDQSNYFQAKPDAIFSRYHDLVLKWWKQPHDSYYLTQEDDIFQQAINSIIKDPQMSAMHAFCMINIKRYNYTFTDDAVNSLNLQDHSTTVITAENTTLTVIKVMQRLKNKDYVVLDINNIVNLSTIDRYTFCSELIKNDDKVVILICTDLQECADNKQQEKNDIIEIVTVRHKNTIIVTNRTSIKILKNYFPKADKILYDKKLCLSDISEDSQMRILNTAMVTFPGVEISLELLLRDRPVRCSRSAGGTAGTPAGADSETGTGSTRTDEEQSVPGPSRDPL